MKNYHILFTLALAAFTISPLQAQDKKTQELQKQQSIRDLDPASEARMNNRTRSEISLGGAYVFDLGSDAQEQEGWGMAVSWLFLPERDLEYKNWQLKFGPEFYYFSTSGDQYNGGVKYRETVDAGQVYINLGLSYTFQDFLEIGAIVGTGLGGSYGETTSPGDKERNGNFNWSLQFKPQISLHITENVSLYAAYRVAYIGPFYRTDLIGYRSVDIIHQSGEVGLTWRF
ncbi:MAG: porin family protein [Puniceicoccales bacterium]|jgi:hypothetical protein|nr:porin family protein [Puniceicoccales bacterium]